MILNDPQYLSRSILRSEIHSDIQENGRKIKRILFPRYGIDEAPLTQNVIFDTDNKMCHYETIMDEFGIRNFYIKIPKFTFGFKSE